MIIIFLLIDGDIWNDRKEACVIWMHLQIGTRFLSVVDDDDRFPVNNRQKIFLFVLSLSERID